MRRSLVTSSCALALALAPAIVCAQTPPAQPPAQTPPAQQQPAPAQPEQNAPPKLGFTTPAGLLLVQIKPDQTAAFEEMVGKLKAGLAKSQDPTLQKEAAGLRFYKASEPMGTEKNALYVVVVDPATANAEYAFLNLLQKTLTPEEQRAPETQALFQKYAGAFTGGINKLNLTPVGGGM